jgi:predicted PurR-regulated permease PerM
MAGILIVVVSTAVLYWAQIVCIPVAVAMFLTVVLAPLVAMLERWRLGRVPAVLLAVLMTMLIVGGIVWVVAAQARNLAVELPQYAENIHGRVKALRQMAQSPLTAPLGHLLREITGELKPPRDGENASPGNPAANSETRVVVQPETPPWMAYLPSLLGRLAETLGALAMALVLLVFMLLRREDLRNRLIRLSGDGQLTTTTRALDDAGQRISRYLFTQVLVNSLVGLTLAVGMLAIGLPYALLWGFLTFVLRYMPYAGIWVAAIPPVLVSLGMFPGWLQPALAIGLFLLVELITSNAIEPRLYGRSIGVSEIAFLVAAAFGAFLWGPIGIILSSPIIVCLVVLGKHVSYLKFLDVLLGDEPVLTPEVVYYQRLLARDQDEALEVVLTRMKASSTDKVFDDLFIPAMNYCKRDREREELSETDAQFVLDVTREMLEELDELHVPVGAGEPRDKSETSPTAKVRVLACAARDEADRLALAMLGQLLSPRKWEVEIVPSGTLTSELVGRAVKEQPGVVCIAALPPGGLARARYLCKRLQTRLPGIRVVVGRWGLKDNIEGNNEQLRQAGAALMTTTLLETRAQLETLFPLLAHQEGERANDSSADAAERRAAAAMRQTVPR